MRLTNAVAALLTVSLMLPAAAARAQTPRKIRIVLDVRGENETAVGRMMADVRRELQTVPDVELVPPSDSPRMIRVIVASVGSVSAASVLVTERYDRETLMVLGIEDDEMAFKMMALQIVMDHQIFTGPGTADIAKSIVTSLDTGVFAKLRALPPRP